MHFGPTARVCEALVSLTKRAPHAVIANSQAATDLLWKRGFARSRVHHVPNGIDASQFYADDSARARLREKWGVSEMETLIGVVGRIEPAKDQETFVRACGILARKRSDLRFVCVGRGWGSSAYLESVRRAALEADVSERMIWADPEPDPRAVHNALDVACSSSRSEGFPNVVGEAMACGRPLVVTDVGDSAFVVGDCWPVVGSGDPESLAAAVARLLDVDDLQVRGERGRLRIQEQFSIAQLAERTLNVVHGLDTTRRTPLSAVAADARE